MTAEEDARQDVLDAVERLRGPASLLPPVRVQRQYEFERLLDVYVAEATEEAYNGGVSDGKRDGFDAGKEEGHNEGLVEGQEEGDQGGYERGYELGKNDGLEEGLRRGQETGYEEGRRAGFDEAERGEE